jgi:type IV pilus assembly protein PilE
MKSLTAPHASRLALKPNGFTLIELMVVVAIVGILASVAYPSYMNQVRKSRRSDAVAALSAVQQAQERWRANKVEYSSDVSSSSTGLKLIASATVASSYITTSGYYTVAISSPTATGYVATATAVSGTSQASDTGCTTLTVNVTNGNATNPTAEANCWSK